MHTKTYTIQEIADTFQFELFDQFAEESKVRAVLAQLKEQSVQQNNNKKKEEDFWDGF